ncbi:molybdopterin adenylyltransferase [Limisphaera ngatamarikiensis]|jgi:molybdopterin adenylyltransferase|uniref:molybdopterin adenylyltransferase n=1 Tax=Limisphaera ngatamarikiensis TaxID=1324935 RepID=UPI001F0E5D65|nr:molybdopterin adenylyltransferase [Limisphaera ngatamarikiensis]
MKPEPANQPTAWHLLQTRPLRVGRLTVSDRASAGLYEDRSGPEIERIVRQSLQLTCEFLTAVVPDDVDRIRTRIQTWADQDGCDLILTTGGTGITPRDVTPEATRPLLEKELPGFGEAMRLHSLPRVPTAILSRATAGIRGRCLIINLPGKPSAIAECLDILRMAILEALAHLRGLDPHDTRPAT